MSTRSRWQPQGRGGRYGPIRAVVEAGLRRLYRRDWPARLWGLTPNAARVDLLELTLPILPANLPPLTLAFATDLHLGPTTASKTLDRALEHLQQAKPDVLLLGGDYVFLDATDSIAAKLSRWVAAVPAKIKVAVLGNHDLWTHHELIEAALRTGGAQFFVNESIKLPSPHHQVAVIGLDDPATGHPDIDEAFADTDEATVGIVVCHSSDVLEMVSRRGARLLLAGHTHGGHIALPGSIPVIVPGRFGRSYPFGFHTIDGLSLFVSRGVGGVELPVRAFAHPDVALITLTSSLATYEEA